MSVQETAAPYSQKSLSERLDQAGMTASLLCAVHCALMPLAITLLPLLGLSFLADSRMEWALVVLAAVLGTTSLTVGYRQHRSTNALRVLFAGLAILVAGRLFETYAVGQWAVGVVVAGGVIIAIAHSINLRLSRTCECHSPS